LRPAPHRSVKSPIRIVPLGDSALLVRVCEDYVDRPEQTLDAVLNVRRCLEMARLPGIIETAPAYTTVALFFDPVRVLEAGGDANAIFDWLADRVRKCIADCVVPKAGSSSRLVEIPVCYDREFAPDLDRIARHAGLGAQQIIDLHSRPEYHVHCLGFTPGFPYLSGLPGELATPRRPVPQKEIAAGSVAIGGSQTGIYPVKSPGGWNVIGRTPLPLFDPQKNPPTLLRAGDRIRFRVITREEFEAAKRSSD
jgi:inhibitor of KinA